MSVVFFPLFVHEEGESHAAISQLAFQVSLPLFAALLESQSAPVVQFQSRVLSAHHQQTCATSDYHHFRQFRVASLAQHAPSLDVCHPTDRSILEGPPCAHLNLGEQAFQVTRTVM